MGDRLKWAREQAGFKSARKAARRHHWGVSTYSAHENGQNDFDDEAAKVYARAYGKSAGWLMTGDGEPGRKNIVGVKGLIGAGGTIDTGAEQIPEGENLYEIEVPFPLPAGALAFQVSGPSMFPRYDPGDAVICEKFSTNIDGLLNRIVAVQSIDGARYLKKLLKGAKKGIYDLESFNAPLMRSVRLRWAAPILSVLPADQWRRIEARDQALPKGS